ncbi:hypothetical protein PENTCL1PPCAC_30733, partial [Pristionchus entomophagus]
RLYSDAEIDLLKDELKALKQGGRSVHLYADEVRRSAEKAYPGSTEEIGRTRDREARENFITGLDDSIRLDVRKAAPQSFQQCVRTAQQMESVNRKEKKDQKIDTLIDGVNALLTSNSRQQWNRQPQSSFQRPFPQYSGSSPQYYRGNYNSWRGNYRPQGEWRGGYRGQWRGGRGYQGNFRGNFRGNYGYQNRGQFYYRGARGRGVYTTEQSEQPREENEEQEATRGTEHRKVNGRLAKYQIQLLEYNLKILYRRGRLNVVADALSRFTPDEVKEPLPDRKHTVFAIGTTDFKEMQRSSPRIQGIINCMESDEDSPLSRKYRRKFILKNGLLYLSQKGRWENPSRIVLPEDSPQVLELINHFHRSPHLAAHAGVEKTLQLLASRAYWEKMKDMVSDVVRNCRECARSKTFSNENTVELMNPMINTTKHCVTKLTPFFALFGRHPLVPEDANFEIDKKTKEGNMEEIWRQLKTTIESNNQRQLVKFKRNRRVRNREVRSGDAVLVNRAPPAHKLTAKR